MSRKIPISEAPLMSLFGSKAAYLVLMYLENYGEGYASQIAKTFKMSLSQVQNQLQKFEQLSLLVSRKQGSSRLYTFNRNPISDALRLFLRTMFDSLPDSTIENFYRNRRRPRRYGKR